MFLESMATVIIPPSKSYRNSNSLSYNRSENVAKHIYLHYLYFLSQINLRNQGYITMSWTREVTKLYSVRTEENIRYR